MTPEQATTPVDTAAPGDTTAPGDTAAAVGPSNRLAGLPLFATPAATPALSAHALYAIPSRPTEQPVQRPPASVTRVPGPADPTGWQLGRVAAQRSGPAAVPSLALAGQA